MCYTVFLASNKGHFGDGDFPLFSTNFLYSVHYYVTPKLWLSVKSLDSLEQRLNCLYSWNNTQHTLLKNCAFFRFHQMVLLLCNTYNANELLSLSSEYINKATVVLCNNKHYLPPLRENKNKLIDTDKIIHHNPLLGVYWTYKTHSYTLWLVFRMKDLYLVIT